MEACEASWFECDYVMINVRVSAPRVRVVELSLLLLTSWTFFYRPTQSSTFFGIPHYPIRTQTVEELHEDYAKRARAIVSPNQKQQHFAATQLITQQACQNE